MSSSDSDDENIIRYGTPLEPYEEDEIPSKRKYQQPADQYAVDAHGRRRFHGAFTGGFSAGFGNTVGTPEGFTPAAFKSSRKSKATISGQRPEDFMDEEDRSEYGIAPKQMQTQSEFSGQKRQKQQQFHDGPIPGVPVLQELLKPVHETAAVRMLRAMGWREGQGAGGRLTAAEKRAERERNKVYGCYMPDDVRQKDDQDSDDSEFDYDTLFAPDDYEPCVLSRKSDRFGLGYSGLSRHSVLGDLSGEYGQGASTSHLIMKEKGKKVSIRGQAFGVGAFETDDGDIYATEDMSHYDFEMGPKPSGTTIPARERGPNVLAGFVKATHPLPPLVSAPPPALPRGYSPAAAGKRRTRFEPTAVAGRDQGLGRHELTAEARGELLGETRTVIPTNTQTSPPVDPIAKIVGRNVDFVSTITEEKKEMDYIPIADSGKDLTKVFKPFASNPKKQSRYEQYLKDKSSVVWEKDGTTDRLSEWERDREMAEFEQSAKLYTPLTGCMAERFTYASQPDEALNPLCAVAKSNNAIANSDAVEAAKKGLYGVMTRSKVDWQPDARVSKRFNVPEVRGMRSEPKREEKQKVSYSIFNYLESSVHDRNSFAKEQSKFSGSKSLQRENVVGNNSNKIDTVGNSSKNNKDTIDESTNIGDIGNTNPISSTTVESFGKRMTVVELFLKESQKDLESETKVTETIEKFDKMDLYKSIFLSDSEEETDNTINNEIDKNIDVNDYIDKPKNTERNLSPSRGIFANIDFDEMNSWRENPGKRVEEPKKDVEKVDANNETKDEVNEEDFYGPKIPDNLKKRLESDDSKETFKPIFRSKVEREEVVISSDDSDSWVDANEAKKKLKKKKNKKHKSKHKKAKHKKKDK